MAVSTEGVDIDDDDDNDDDGVSAKRPRRDDDNIDSSDVTDVSMSWPHAFTTDRLTDHEAVLPFER